MANLLSLLFPNAMPSDLVINTCFCDELECVCFYLGLILVHFCNILMLFYLFGLTDIRESAQIVFLWAMEKRPTSMAEFYKIITVLVQKQQLWVAALLVVQLWKAKDLDSDPHQEPKTILAIRLRLQLQHPLLLNQRTTMILHHHQRTNRPQVPVLAPATVEVLVLVEVICFCSGGKERKQGSQGLRSELSLMTHHLHPQLLSRLRENLPPQVCHHLHLLFLPLLLLMPADPEGKLLPFFRTGISITFLLDFLLLLLVCSSLFVFFFQYVYNAYLLVKIICGSCHLYYC